MAAINKNACLTLTERQIIQTGIENGTTKKAIADTIGKDNSTVGKEILNHRYCSYKCSLPLECSNYRHCMHGRQCTPDCIDYIKFKCNRRDRSPGACNKCPDIKKCRFDKFIYSAAKAHSEFRETLVDSRVGVNLTVSEAQTKASIIKPLLDQGQSPYEIITNHPELDMCEKTLYNYIEDGVFENFGIISLDLRNQTKRRIPKKKKTLYKKREDKSYLKGRTYKDYQNYIEDESFNVVQMDTVYNDVSNGPFMQTFKFINYGFLFVVYHEKKDQESMKQGVEHLEKILGRELFEKEVQIILTDRGSEFICADAFENREDGTRRTRVFYCDPMASCQKGSLENKHIELRYICPSKCDLKSGGLTGQDKADRIVSHINSVPLKSLKNKTAIETMKFYSEELWNRFEEYGIEEIEKDKVVLKPYLLKD